MSSLRSLALKSEGQSALDSRRLSRELSELGATDPGRDSASGEATIMEDPTLVVALLNIAGVLFFNILLLCHARQTWLAAVPVVAVVSAYCTYQKLR